MDPEKKKALILRLVRLIALLMLVIGWVMIIVLWE